MKGYNKKVAEYWRSIRTSKTSLNDWIEAPAFKKLIPKNLNKKRVLDLGCGTGETAIYLAKKNAKVIAVEASKEMLKFAPEHKNITYYNIPAEKINFKNNYFDIVISQLSLDYIKNLDNILTKIHKILKKNGLFLVSLPHPFRKAFKKKSVSNVKSAKLIGYFNEGIFESNWEGNIVKYYTRILQTYFNTFTKNKFIVNKILEPKPSNKLKKINIEFYEYYSKIPFVIIFELIKK